MNIKRALSLILALCLCLTMLPAPASAEETENITVCGVDIGIQAGTHMQYTNAYGGSYEDGYYYNGVSLLSTQCLGFARWCQYKLYGYHKAEDPGRFYPVSVNGVSSVPAGSLTVGKLKELVLASQPGAHLRTLGLGHSMIITEITEDGFSIVQCNGSNNNEYSGWRKNYVGTYTYTWESYINSTYGERGIEFIELPYEYPFNQDHTEHTFTGTYYDTEHPHKIYQRCFCGERLYTEETATDFDCEICYPLDTRFDSVLPFKAYLKDLDEAYPFTTPAMDALTGGEIWASDECAVSAVYENGACKVTYPAGDGYQTAYLPLFLFVEDTEASPAAREVYRRMITYRRGSTAYGAMYGYAGAGDEVYTLGEKGDMTQLFYHTSGGYKLAWALTEELSPDAYDARFDAYGALYGYPCATQNFNAYEVDRVTYSGKIYTTDDCVIHAIYADGWCQVTYPVTGGTRTGYTQLSNFIYDPAHSHTEDFIKTDVVTYQNKDLTDAIGWLFEGETFYVAGVCENATQVLYPREDGYQLAWIGDWESGAVAVHQYMENGEERTVYYPYLEEALASANSGVVTLLADTQVHTVFVSPNVTLDLGGKVLTAQTLVVMNGATVTDGGADCIGGGLLKIGRENLIFARDNGQNIIPVWNGADGYVLTRVTFLQTAVPAAGAAQYIFLPRFSNAQASGLMADGCTDNGIQIRVCMSWAEGRSQQYYTYGDELVKQVFDGTGRWVFDLKVTGIEGIGDMIASPVVTTDCGLRASADGIPLAAAE